MAQVKSFREQLRRDSRGNVMYMTAGLLMPILATVGAGVDLGQSYMAKSRLQQACDAGVLAGRRSMADGAFGTDDAAAAARMFNFNYQPGQYGSTGVVFTPVAQGTNEVKGTATATVPTIIMRIFGRNSVSMSVSCTAKLEIANADIMFVLDTTGSMSQTNAGDSVSKITALRTEVMAFYDTVAQSQTSDSIVRYGFVPYTSTVNVGPILLAANRSWLSNSSTLPSRRANFQTIQPSDTTGYGTVTQINVVDGSYANTGTYYTGYSQTACNALAAPAPGSASATNSASTTQTGTGSSGSNTLTYFNTNQNFTQTIYRYQYQSSGARCYVQQATRTFTQVSPSTVTHYPSYQQFVNYTYDVMTYNVGNMIDGTPLVVNNGTNGTDVTASWNGCIMERDTVQFSSGNFAPAGALDLNIDLVPNSSDSTKWHILMPNMAYPNIGYSTTAQTTTTDQSSYAPGTSLGNGGYSACPTAALRLASYSAAQRANMQNYVNSLTPFGGTYHDVGMVWGTRLISPTGLFASDNAVAANGNPISRHIVFMTDGDMAPASAIYGFQGQEAQMGRVGSTNTTTLTSLHNTRFLTACNEAKARNITVWVVSFGTTLNSTMAACASGTDKAFQANNSTQLHQQFQNIASQITRLRLSQ